MSFEFITATNPALARLRRDTEETLRRLRETFLQASVRLVGSPASRRLSR
jgi:hypothetical protein